MRRYFLCCFTFAVQVAVFRPSAFAATLEVCPSECPYSSIQEAIADSSNGDTVRVHEGTYIENIDFLGKAITVASVSGAADTIIDGNTNGSVVSFVSDEDSGSQLEGFTLTHGSGTPFPSQTYGGGIYCYYASPTITECIIENNSVEADGGGIHSHVSSPIISNCVIRNNAALGKGGGICFHSSSAPGLQGCTISENTAAGDGGGVHFSYLPSDTPAIENCIISGNTSHSNGGGFYNISPRLLIRNSMVTGNSSAHHGGGVYLFSAHEVKIVNSTFSANRVTDRYGRGGAVYSPAPTSLEVINSILWGDRAGNEWEEIGSLEPEDISVQYSNIQGGWSGEGNIDTTPQFVDRRFADQAPTGDGDYHLTPCSPCVDIGTGDTGAFPILPRFDIDGESRPRFLGYDLGADENAVLTRNNPPIAQDDASMGTEDSPLLVEVIANDHDPDGDPIEIVSYSSPGWGTIADHGDGTFTYTPDANQNGRDSFTYMVSDGTCTGSAVAVLNIEPEDDPPFQVCPEGCTYQSIQEAINSAGNGDTVLVHDGTYVENIDFLGKAISAQSVNGAGTTIIDGSSPPDLEYAIGSVVTFASGEGRDSLLDGFNLVNGIGTITDPRFDFSKDGGGVFVDGSSPTIRNCTIEDHGDDFLFGIAYGGGIYIDSVADPLITNCTIRNNDGGGGGGGIYIGEDSSAHIEHCTITDNEALQGGGIYARDLIAGIPGTITITGTTVSGNDGSGIHLRNTQAVIEDCLVSGNTGSGAGGIDVSGLGTIITNSRIEGNIGSSSGGGIDSYGALLNISRCTINNNRTASSSGGGINAYGSSILIDQSEVRGNVVEWSTQTGGGIASGSSYVGIINSTLSGNSAPEGAAILSGIGSVTEIINSTISGNSASMIDGGTIYGAWSDTIVLNSIIWGNAGGVFTENPEFPAYSFDVFYSDMDENWPGIGNTAVDPLFVEFRDASEAPTTEGDYHLTNGSPCIDTGTGWSAPLYDIDSDPRPLGAGFDMGSDEYPVPAPLNPLPDIKANGSDGPLTISRGETLIVTVELEARDHADLQVDWWALAETSFPDPRDWFSFDALSRSWSPGISPAYQGPCNDLSQQEIYRSEDLPPGDYQFHFGVDMNMNGRLDPSELYLDQVEVTIAP